MPVNKEMMKKMEKKYGKEKAKDVYYAVEKKQRGNKLVFGAQPKKANKSKKG
jgi:hypothetical protein